MGTSLLSRGLRRLRREKNRQVKNAGRYRYLDCRENMPVDPALTLLEARNGRAIDGNIYYILQELIREPVYADLKLCLVTEDDAAEAAMRRKLANIPAAMDRVTFVRLSSEAYYECMATAGFIVNDATIGNFFVKREGQVYLNVWHGTPLKTMGRKVSHEPHAAGNVQKNFIVADYLLYPSRYMMDHMIEDYMLENLSQATVLLGGYPRNAAFFDEERRQTIREALAPAGERLYAYMPTWRPALMGEALQGILEEMDAGLEENEQMIVNLHPLAQEGVDFSRFRSIRPFPADYENYEILNAADALLTDYSSVFYDFAVTRRPVVLFTYDEAEYFATRGLYEPISSLPFPQTGTVTETLAALRAERGYDDRAFLDKYCRYESAEAAGILCREVFLGERSMQREQIPDNGLPNVLVWGGDLAPGARTDQVFDWLAAADQTRANYYLTFNRADLKERFPILFDLPPGIDYIGRPGKMLLSPRQEEAVRRYQKGRLSFQDYWEAVRPAFARERFRFYGNMRIDRIVRIPEGSPPGPDASGADLEFAAYEIEGERSLL